MYLIDTKLETIFFNLGLIPGTLNGVLRYAMIIFIPKKFLTEFFFSSLKIKRKQVFSERFRTLIE